MTEVHLRRRLILGWTEDELPSVQQLVLGPTVMGFFEGTSAWHEEMAESDDGFDHLLDAVFFRIRHAERDKRGGVRIHLSTRQVEAVLYYADVMLDATDPANTGDDDRAEFNAAKRLVAQIGKKWPDARLGALFGKPPTTSRG